MKELEQPILVAGAGGFIGGHLVRRLITSGYKVRAADVKPMHKWWQVHEEAENLHADMSNPAHCAVATDGCKSVFNLACNMGGIGFIEKHRVECMRSVLINTHLIEAAHRAGVTTYFYSSSACVYNSSKQSDVDCAPLAEADAYPAMAERGYGWEKLYSEMLCQEYAAERGMRTFIARFHNCYGPNGSWDGGREKAPSAICRKVIMAKRDKTPITIWGDGTRTRSYMYVDDCVKGIMLIVQCDGLVAKPVNLGRNDMVSVNRLVDIIEGIAGVKLERVYDMSAPQGVMGRNSDNTFIKQMLGWEPSIPLERGLRETYNWIEQQISKV